MLPRRFANYTLQDAPSLSLSPAAVAAAALALSQQAQQAQQLVADALGEQRYSAGLPGALGRAPSFELQQPAGAYTPQRSGLAPQDLAAGAAEDGTSMLWSPANASQLLQAVAEAQPPALTLLGAGQEPLAQAVMQHHHAQQAAAAQQAAQQAAALQPLQRKEGFDL